MSDRPAPYPADTRAKGWRFELDYEKIDQSDTWDLAAEIPMAQHALMMMWMVAWRQEPCGSLPNDEALIRSKCRVPPEMWLPMRDVMMRGWWLADDGRLYHDTIAERVMNMLETRGVDRSRQDARRNLFELIRERDGRACVYCGHAKYLTLDHILPLTRGGDNDERNLAIACRPCNSKKSARTPEEAGMSFVNQAVAKRWVAYKESAGEKRSGADACGVPACNGGSRLTNDTGTGTSSSPTSKKKPRAKPAGPPCPDGVTEQVWLDWLELRAKKRAPVTQTVVDGLHAEACKAGMSVEAFLRIWCQRGTQGLQADWLKPHERQGAPPAETPYARQMRERAQVLGPGVAAKPPGQPNNIIVLESDGNDQQKRIA